MKKMLFVLYFVLLFFIMKSFTNEIPENSNTNGLSTIERKGFNYYINDKLLKKDSDFLNLYHSNEKAKNFYNIAISYKKEACSLLISGILSQILGLSMIAIPISPIGMFMTQLMMAPVAFMLLIHGIIISLFPIVTVAYFVYALKYYLKFKEYSINIYNGSVIEKKYITSELFINHFDLFCMRL